MTEITLKNRLGIFLVVAHFGVLLLVLGFWIGGYYLREEATTAILIIAPFFAAYTTAIIKFVAAQRHKIAATGKRVTEIFVFFSFLVPGLFVLVVASAVVLKAMNVGLKSFEDFKTMLGGAETIFGVYAGQLIFSMFERADAAQEPAKKGAVAEPDKKEAAAP